MMRLRAFGVVFSASFPAVALLALSVVCDRKGTVTLCVFSSLLHEMGHIIVMRLKGAHLKSVSFNLGEVAINADTSELSYGDEALVAIGGVTVNLLMAALGFGLWKITSYGLWFNFFVINGFIFCFNMLPIRLLDGGEVLVILLRRRVSEKTVLRIINLLSFVFLVPLGTIGLISVFNSRYNFSLLFATLYLICTLVSKEFKNVS